MQGERLPFSLQKVVKQDCQPIAVQAYLATMRYYTVLAYWSETRLDFGGLAPLYYLGYAVLLEVEVNKTRAR